MPPPLPPAVPCNSTFHVPGMVCRAGLAAASVVCLFHRGQDAKGPSGLFPSLPTTTSTTAAAAHQAATTSSNPYAPSGTP